MDQSNLGPDLRPFCGKLHWSRNVSDEDGYDISGTTIYDIDNIGATTAAVRTKDLQNIDEPLATNPPITKNNENTGGQPQSMLPGYITNIT